MTDTTTQPDNLDRARRPQPIDSEEYVQPVLDELDGSRSDLDDHDVRSVLAVLDDIGVGPRVAQVSLDRLDEVAHLLPLEWTQVKFSRKYDAGLYLEIIHALILAYPAGKQIVQDVKAAWRLRHEQESS